VVTVDVGHREATTPGAVASQEAVRLSGLTLCPSLSEASALNARDEVYDAFNAPIIPALFFLTTLSTGKFRVDGTPTGGEAAPLPP
jgi:hypothetical protein